VLALVIGWQYWSYFGTGETSTIVWAPLLVASYFAKWPLLKALLSILLPLTVLAAYRTCVVRDLWLQIAWPTFGIAAAYSYLLAETRARHMRATGSGLARSRPTSSLSGRCS
jgi:hypothetical protein